MKPGAEVVDGFDPSQNFCEFGRFDLWSSCSDNKPRYQYQEAAGVTKYEHKQFGKAVGAIQRLFPDFVGMRLYLDAGSRTWNFHVITRIRRNAPPMPGARILTAEEAERVVEAAEELLNHLHGGGELPARR